MLKRILALMMAACLVILAVQLAAAQPETQDVVRVASLKGPTSMGLSKLIKDHEGKGDYEFTVAGTADEIAPLLARGDADIALIPCNLAAVLHQKLEGGLQIAAINTLGVLYVVEKGDTVQQIGDLKGQVLLSTGKGTTPEYALNYILQKNGIDPAADLTIDFRSEATEVAAALGNGTASLAVLPQPFVTAAMAQDEGLRIALSLTDEWAKVSPDSAMVTGVVAVRKAFADEHPDLLSAFMSEYAQSTAYVNEHPAEAGPWIEELGIAKAAIAEKAIPACNIVCITGDEMVRSVSGYLSALFEQNPQSVGGKLPDEAFYITDIGIAD